MKKIIWQIVAVLVAVAIVIGCIVVAVGNSEGAERPQIEISLKVTNIEKKSTSFKLKTNGEYLLDALLSDNFADGEMREEGFWITRVADISAESSEHWQIYVNGKLTAKKADKIKINNGDSFELKLISKKNNNVK